MPPVVSSNPNYTGIGNTLASSNLEGGGIASSMSPQQLLREKIMAHPNYHRLLAAYVNCQKIGAPPETVARLEEACASAAAMRPGGTSCVSEDPSLDQFMEAYYEMLIKYEQELSKPLKEASLFLARIERQFKALTICLSDSDKNGWCEEEIFNSFMDPEVDDEQLKGQLLQKYRGCLGSLKQEFTNKKKNGKLPKQVRQQLLNWWTTHYKWPYPSESEKLALAESTGLEQKQINNWFINQRKRHWKPSHNALILDRAAAFMDNPSA